MSYLIPKEFEELRDENWFKNNVENVVLEHTEDNHYKYYHLSQEENDPRFRPDMPYLKGKIFLANYGRIGQNPKRKEYVNANGLTMYAQMLSKLKKGYKLKLYKTFSEARSKAYNDFLEWIGGEELFD